MAKYNVHAGHCPDGLGASGAVGIIKESTEARKVKNELIKLMKADGHTVYDCTCETKQTAKGCLTKIVNKCNDHLVDLDISIHFNDADSKTANGTECYYYSSNGATKIMATRICNSVSKLGFRNRGAKTKSLYVINRTNSPAVLVECCFVNSQKDISFYHPKTMAKAIYDGIRDNKSSNPKPTQKPNPTKPQKQKIAVDGMWGTATCKALQREVGTTVDGIISGQNTHDKGRHSGVYCAKYNNASKSGSELIRFFQNLFGIKDSGKLDRETILNMQKYFGTKQDGFISYKSDMVRAMQRWVNSKN